MSNKNRSSRIQLLQKVLTKNFTPVSTPKDRNVLEHLIYACCLEDAPYDSADEAFHRLQESFFDWNEVRVTTVTELMEHLSKLPDPKTAAMRLKKNLQSIFEVRYSFDLEDLIKMNQGKAVAELEKLGGMTPFVLAYVTQSALGGHSIPVSGNMIKVLLILEIVSPTEAEKHQTPGLERTISKAKGADFGSCLHQLGLLVAGDPNAKNTKAILKDAGAPEPKKPSKADEKAAAAKKEVSSKPTGKASAPSKVDATTKTAPTKTAAGKSAASAKATAPSKDQDDKAKAIPAAKAPAPKKAAPPKSANPPKAASKGKADSGAAKKPVAKKPASSKPAAKSAPPNRKPR
jgi:hypothetical protein